MAETQLKGPQKAAIALLSLDEEIATQVLGKMTEPDVRRLVEAVEALDDVRSEVITSVLEDLERGISSPLAVVKTGGTKYVRKLADAAFGSDRAGKLFGVITPPTDPLQLLRTARVNAIAQLLTEEHPQIAAVVMTQLESSVAAKVLALMPQDTAADLTARISELEEIPEHAVAEA
jgi:flagellar motor switch protein FliG